MSSKISCIIVDDEHTAREIIASHLSKINRLEIITCRHSGMDAFKCMSTPIVDLIHLDMNVPVISSISYAISRSKETKMIFSTA